MRILGFWLKLLSPEQRSLQFYYNRYSRYNRRLMGRLGHRRQPLHLIPIDRGSGRPPS